MKSILKINEIMNYDDSKVNNVDVSREGKNHTNCKKHHLNCKQHAKQIACQIDETLLYFIVLWTHTINTVNLFQ